MTRTFVMPIAAILLVFGFAVGCSTPEERAARAQERSYKAHGAVAEKRLQLVDQYQNCVKNAAGNKQMIEACDSYLRSAEALK